MSSLIDALDGIVGVEPELQTEPESTAINEAEAIPTPETESGPEPQRAAEAIGGVAMLEQEARPEPEPSVNEDEVATSENQLTTEISQLWSQHVELSGTRRTTAKELRQVRARLAEKLYEMKSLLVSPGRGGEWRGWLRERKIPRSTADRLVARHAEMLGGGNVGNVPSGAINDGEDGVEKLVRSLLPRLKRNLPDTQSVFKFIAAVGEAFGLQTEITDGCVMVSKPKPDENAPAASAADAPESDTTEAAFPNADSPPSEPVSTSAAQA